MTCTLNVTIPQDVVFAWYYNGSIVEKSPRHFITKTDDATTLQIEDLGSPDAGVYQCVTNDDRDGWTLRRIITLGRYAPNNWIHTLRILKHFRISLVGL